MNNTITISVCASRNSPFILQKGNNTSCFSRWHVWRRLWMICRLLHTIATTRRAATWCPRAGGIRGAHYRWRVPRLWRSILWMWLGLLLLRTPIYKYSLNIGAKTYNLHKKRRTKNRRDWNEKKLQWLCTQIYVSTSILLFLNITILCFGGRKKQKKRKTTTEYNCIWAFGHKRLYKKSRIKEKQNHHYRKHEIPG